MDSKGLHFSPDEKVTRNEPSIPPRSRKNGGWADDDVSKTNKSKRNSTNLIEQERFKSPDRQSKDDSDDDIPLIPDLDEIQEDEILCKVADAPFVAGNKVASFTELDTDLGKKSFLSILENINLNSLTNHLLPEDDIKEDNLQWTWDLLFTEVASDLRYEWDAQTKDVLKD
uniref:Intraflagellar transport protein 43 homolog n=1 Tax=Clastoptera arizonana TaxID=38151 RepID=A0A1B6DCF7_9HEMI